MLAHCKLRGGSAILRGGSAVLRGGSAVLRCVHLEHYGQHGLKGRRVPIDELHSISLPAVLSLRQPHLLQLEIGLPDLAEEITQLVRRDIGRLQPGWDGVGWGGEEKRPTGATRGGEGPVEGR